MANLNMRLEAGGTLKLLTWPKVLLKPQDPKRSSFIQAFKHQWRNHSRAIRTRHQFGSKQTDQQRSLHQSHKKFKYWREASPFNAKPRSKVRWRYQCQLYGSTKGLSIHHPYPNLATSINLVRVKSRPGSHQHEHQRSLGGA